MEGRDINDKFVQLASAGYAVTGSFGIGIRGELQIGFDIKSKMFVIKVKAKATLGLGAGGAMEFAVSSENVWWFIRFVHAQLNDHNFSFLLFFEWDAYSRFCAWSWELLKQGRLLDASLTRFGAEGMLALGKIKDLLDLWDKYNSTEDEADELAELVNTGTLLLGYLNPEVKGRLLDKLCHSSWNPLDNDDNKEMAILRVLNTIASQREFQEIKEHMGAPIHESDKAKRDKIKQGNIFLAENKLNAILNHQYKTDYENWQKSLPDVAPRLVT